MTARPATRVLLAQFGWAAGHHPDYVAAVLGALESLRPAAVVQFWPDARRSTRAGGYLREFALFLRFALRGGGVVISQSPTFMDFIAFALALVLTRWWRRTTGLFVLRREVQGLVGGRRYWKTDLLAWLIPWMLRHGWLYPVFDSRQMREYWAPGRGVVLPIPPPGGGIVAGGRPGGGPVIGLLGAIRDEKGARYYDTVIEATLAISPDARAVVQVGGGSPLEARDVAAALVRRWSGEPRVRLVAGHVPSEGYVALLAETDVVVIPYDPAMYGGGTSGVMHDALSLHRVALATPITWAREEYAEHPDVVWLERLDAASIAAGLRQAVDRAMVLRREDPDGTPAPSPFAEAWRRAVQAAAETPQ